MGLDPRPNVSLAIFAEGTESAFLETGCSDRIGAIARQTKKRPVGPSQEEAPATSHVKPSVPDRQQLNVCSDGFRGNADIRAPIQIGPDHAVRIRGDARHGAVREHSKWLSAAWHEAE